jgi:hypothetical protein
MKLEEIQDLWERDARIDRTNLSVESLGINVLHQKYWKIFSQERLRLVKLDQEVKKLRHDKWVFYIQGPTSETVAAGWEMPPSGRVLKPDVNGYIDSDPDVIKLNLTYGLQKEKVQFLESIISMIQFRSNQIKNAVEWAKFEAGG